MHYGKPVKARLKKNRQLRIVIYVRVSKEREGMISPELQRHECEALERRIANAVRAMVGANLDGVIVDLDISGRTFDRPGIQEVFALAEDGMIDVVLVWKWNRFGRNTRESLQAIHQLEDLGVTVRAATEDVDTSTAVGEYTRDTLLGLATLQSNQIGEGWQETHRHRLGKGRPHTGTPRLGYTYDKGTKEQKGTQEYAIDPVTGPLVADAYRRFIKGETMASITRSMTASGLTTVRGNPLEQNKFFRTLDSGFAAGLLQVGVSSDDEEAVEWLPGSHDPLITTTEWEAYKARRGTAIKTGQPRKAKYMTSTLMVCDACSGPAKAGVMTKRGKRNPGVESIFHCAQKPKGLCEHYSTVRRRLVEMQVWLWIEAQAEGHEAAAEKLVKTAAASRRRKPQVDSREQLFNRRAKLVDQRQRLTQGWMAKRVVDEDYDALTAKINVQIAEVERDLQALPEEPVEKPPAEAFGELLDVLRGLTVDQQREVLRKLIREIRIRPGKLPIEEKVLIVPAWEPAAA